MTPPVVLITATRAVAVLERYEVELAAAGFAVRSATGAERLSAHELRPLVGDIDALICGDDRVDGAVLDAAPRLRIIAKWGTGIDSIDVDDARRRGILVKNVPGAFSAPVADSVLGYLLLFARQPDRVTDDMRRGVWRHLPLRALGECTLGIIGFGDIGQAVARRATAFGMRLLANSLDAPSAGLAGSLGVTMAPLEAVLAESDFVTLHADMRPENRHLIDADRLRLMRSSACLVNTARGGLVDEAALVAALSAGRLAGAALDVFADEPLPTTSPLRTLPNVYLSPHNTNASPLAAERVHQATIRHVVQALASIRS